MTRKITLTGANIVFLISAVLLILFQTVYSLVAGMSENSIYVMLAAGEFFCILAPVLIYAAMKKANLKETFRLNKPGLVPVLLVVAIASPAYLVALMLNNVVAYLLQFVGKLPTTPIPVPTDITGLLVGILIVGVTPGFCEEMLNRGLLLRAYEKRGTYRALFIVSIFFGLLHFDITNLLGPVFLGLVIGYFVIRTNSIFAGMLAHFLNNTISELADYFSRGKSAPAYITVSSQELLQITALGIAGAIVTALLLLAFRRVTEGRSAEVAPIGPVKRDIVSVASHWPVIILLVLYFIMLVLYIVTIVVLKVTGH